jgi:hypothetical protein
MRRGRSFVEARHQPRHLPHTVGHVGAGAHERRQPPAGRHAPHDHQVVARAAIRPFDLRHSQVHVWRQPAVQFHLAPASLLARVARGEIQEAHGDRLLELVGVVSEEHDH